MICSEMCECGKSEQNLASYYYLLVVKLVVKQKFLLLKNLAHFCTKFLYNFIILINIEIIEIQFLVLFHIS